MIQKHLPKNVFLHLLMVGVLYFSAFSFIALLFQYIDIWLPDPLNFYYNYDFSGINYSIAALLVLFPIFLIVSWLIGREMKNQPELREFELRRWLIYLTLFVTAIAIITGLVMLLYNFLNGELTIRFLLKTLTVFLVTGSVFWYFLRDIKNKISLFLNKALATICSVIIIAVVITGFFLIGSPFYQRQVRLDNQRIGHLQTIQSEIANYWYNKKQLPTELTDINDSLRGFEMPMDPETNKNYGYEITGDLSFKLCADFSTEQTKENSRSGLRYEKPIALGFKDLPSSYWFHPEGRYCFEREIDPDFFSNKRTDLPVPVIY